MEIYFVVISEDFFQDELFLFNKKAFELNYTNEGILSFIKDNLGLLKRDYVSVMDKEQFVHDINNEILLVDNELICIIDNQDSIFDEVKKVFDSKFVF